ncbi:MAG: hypothetical protein R3E32_08840 [Chitinophagales bacterium]
MKYTEELADHLQRKYNLAGSTIRTWKYRGAIPEQYADPDYKEPEAATEKELKELEKLLQLPYLQIKNYRGIEDYRLRDFKRGGGNARIRKEEIKSLRKEISLLRRRIELLLRDKTYERFKKIEELPFVKNFTLIYDYRLYDRIRKQQFTNMSEKDWAYINQRYQKILKELPFQT